MEDNDLLREPLKREQQKYEDVWHIVFYNETLSLML